MLNPAVKSVTIRLLRAKQVPPVFCYVLSLMTKYISQQPVFEYRTHTKQQKYYTSVYFSIQIFRPQTGRSLLKWTGQDEVYSLPLKQERRGGTVTDAT
jgi:hypothetical protein